MTRVWIPTLLLGLLAAPIQAADKDARVYELRTYTVAEGKQAETLKLMSGEGLKTLKKAEITLEAAFVPVDAKDSRVVLLMSHKSMEELEKSWKKFATDEDWLKAAKAANANGQLISKVDREFLNVTDYSPAFKAEAKGDRVFELRTYYTTKGNLGALNDRFRNHTLKLFEKHGMTNIVYWTKLKGQMGEENTMIYFLAHKSVDAAKASFDAFRKDADWVKARTASEEKAGGSLTEKDGVKSLFLKPIEFSPLK